MSIGNFQKRDTAACDELRRRLQVPARLKAALQRAKIVLAAAMLAIQHANGAVA